MKHYKGTGNRKGNVASQSPTRLVIPKLNIVKFVLNKGEEYLFQKIDVKELK